MSSSKNDLANMQEYKEQLNNIKNIPLFTTRSGNNNCSEFEGINYVLNRETYVCSNNVNPMNLLPIAPELKIVEIAAK